MNCTLRLPHELPLGTIVDVLDPAGRVVATGRFALYRVTPRGRICSVVPDGAGVDGSPSLLGGIPADLLRSQRRGAS